MDILAKQTDIYITMKEITTSIEAKCKDSNKKGFYMKIDEYNKLRNISESIEGCLHDLRKFIQIHQNTCENLAFHTGQGNLAKKLLQMCYIDYSNQNRQDALEYLQTEGAELENF